jgi:hypothetical protein
VDAGLAAPAVVGAVALIGGVAVVGELAGAALRPAIDGADAPVTVAVGLALLAPAVAGEAEAFGTALSVVTATGSLSPHAGSVDPAVSAATYR